MTSDHELSDTMRAYAASAMDYAEARFDVALDYSERSLEDVDRILAEWTRSGLVNPERLSDGEREGLRAFCETIGGYVGEVAIRNMGGLGGRSRFGKTWSRPCSSRTRAYMPPRRHQ
ncbi:MAG: hypothetical protein HY928_16155 [Elusimicrobia bacterium]|nr:hypothetical protein [Elusimicrobiota bacterium]